jgi:hypothetical protein
MRLQGKAVPIIGGSGIGFVTGCLFAAEDVVRDYSLTK